MEFRIFKTESRGVYVKKSRYKIIHMVTVSDSVKLMKGQLAYLKNCGYDVTVVSSPGERLYQASKEEDFKAKAINMERTIAPFKDLLSLLKVISYFIKVRPHVCNAGTPKAGLLGMLAAWLTRVPFKVYTIRGLPFEGARGIKRKILILSEKVACACADKVICISPSIKDTAIDYKLTQKNKTIVFGSGSSNGLQLEKYIYNDDIDLQVKEIQAKYSLKNYEFIIGYVGRINNFKGVRELVEAFELLQRKYQNIALMLIGRKETKDPIPTEVEQRINDNPNIIEVGYANDPIPYYYAMDILAFPTYREGFGNVSIEAQATGTPVVATNATGVIDTVVNNETGFLVNVKDIEGLKDAIEKFIVDPKIISEMGEKAKNRVFNEFDSHIIWEGIARLYNDNL